MRSTDAGALRVREAHDKRAIAHTEKQRKARVKRQQEDKEQQR
jgi:hypothetical protein